MSDFFDPYNADKHLMLKCSCGRDHTAAEHQAENAAAEAAATLRARSETPEFEAYSREFIEATLVKALREAPVPYYIPCHHVEHRGPAMAAGVTDTLWKVGCADHRRVGGPARSVQRACMGPTLD